MKIIDERRFSFIPKVMYDSLKKEDREHLNNYRRFYGWYKRTDDQIIELETKLKSLKEKKKDYVNKLTRLNYDLDHLREDFYFSFSITYRPKKKYYSCDLGRKIYKKSGGLGSEKLILEHLHKYYKRRLRLYLKRQEHPYLLTHYEGFYKRLHKIANQ